ncbi:hypothetical protein [Mesorhizobium sp. B2-1-3A]|uniref:hypothetical protein n=1 Tax=Mesorhizobium sp. B2-1-3A TaxID=2589971 RepID=UPI001127428A|nr:hypothetical protein [Mesorhizobium sp. B2-1-3A]TPM94945.1 hypothetical protein FJ977_23055 [Mesorhizobium sp. B2-1-3A]
MTRNDDTYRIEVWDSEEEKTLLETISRSSDVTVSMAAWQAAIRRRPGMLLHYNSRHVMEMILTPGEVKRALFCMGCERGYPVRLEIHKLPSN